MDKATTEHAAFLEHLYAEHGAMRMVECKRGESVARTGDDDEYNDIKARDANPNEPANLLVFDVDSDWQGVEEQLDELYERLDNDDRLEDRDGNTVDFVAWRGIF